MSISLYTYTLVRERMIDRATRAAKTTEDRAAAQQQRRERQTLETEEQREVRMRITHSERMAVETEERREARLQRMRRQSK